MNRSVFFSWLMTTDTKNKLKSGGIRLSRIQTELYIASTRNGDPLCIFEVGCELNGSSEDQRFLLRKLPRWALKLPGYGILYQKTEDRKNRLITNFNVRKIMPIERLIGNFSPCDFSKFMEITTASLRKKYEKENG